MAYTSWRTTEDWRILENDDISGKSQNFIELLPSTQFFPRNENLVSTSQNLEFVSNANDCLWKQFLASYSSQTPSYLICLTICRNSWHSFNLKLEQLIYKKALKFVSVDNYFPDLFIEVQIWHWKPFKFGLGRFSRKIKQIPSKIWLFLTGKAVNKDIKIKRKFCRNHVRNILRLFDGWANFLLTTSETKRDY